MQKRAAARRAQTPSLAPLPSPCQVQRAGRVPLRRAAPEGGCGRAPGRAKRSLAGVLKLRTGWPALGAPRVLCHGLLRLGRHFGGGGGVARRPRRSRGRAAGSACLSQLLRLRRPAQRLPVAFAAGCSGLGRQLDPSCDTDDVRAPRARAPASATSRSPAFELREAGRPCARARAAADARVLPGRRSCPETPRWSCRCGCCPSCTSATWSSPNCPSTLASGAHPCARPRAAARPQRARRVAQQPGLAPGPPARPFARPAYRAAADGVCFAPWRRQHSRRPGGRACGRTASREVPVLVRRGPGAGHAVRRRGPFRRTGARCCGGVPRAIQSSAHPRPHRHRLGRQTRLPAPAHAGGAPRCAHAPQRRAWRPLSRSFAYVAAVSFARKPKGRGPNPAPPHAASAPPSQCSTPAVHPWCPSRRGGTTQRNGWRRRP